jgi:hypothetical protein
MGYKEAQIMPVAEGVPLAVEFDSLPYAGQAIHKYEFELTLQNCEICCFLDKSNYYLDNMHLSFIKDKNSHLMKRISKLLKIFWRILKV